MDTFYFIILLLFLYCDLSPKSENDLNFTPLSFTFVNTLKAH